MKEMCVGGWGGGHQSWPGRNTCSPRDVWLDCSMTPLDMSGMAHLGGNQEAALDGGAGALKEALRGSLQLLKREGFSVVCNAPQSEVCRLPALESPAGNHSGPEPTQRPPESNSLGIRLGTCPF